MINPVRLAKALRGDSFTTAYQAINGSGDVWICAGFVNDPRPGDGTEECTELVTQGLLEEPEVDEDGCFSFKVTAAGKKRREELEG